MPKKMLFVSFYFTASCWKVWVNKASQPPSPGGVQRTAPSSISATFTSSRSSSLICWGKGEESRQRTFWKKMCMHLSISSYFASNVSLSWNFRFVDEVKIATLLRDNSNNFCKDSRFCTLSRVESPPQRTGNSQNTPSIVERPTGI